MSEPAISIIVPVYNSEQYLQNTLDSILSQSFGSFELILVDDGSKDSSGAICDRYQKKDNRIRVIHKENGGICSARNCGLHAAKGEYLAFCDNDDQYLESLLEDNYELAKKYDADVVRYARTCKTVRNGKVIAEESTSFEQGIYTEDTFAENFDQIAKSGEGVWAGIYKRAFLEKHQILFDETMRYGYEDLDFITRIYQCIPRVVLNPNVYYIWVMRYAHSTSGKTDLNNIASLMKCLENRRRLVDQTKIEERVPGFWAEELARRIYTVVRYVSPKKVKMPQRERIDMIRYFGTCEVFQASLSKRQKEALKKHSKAGWIVTMLFYRKCYRFLYFVVTGKERLTAKS